MANKSKPHQPYKTRDLHEAAALDAAGLHLMELIPSPNGFFFIFEDSEDGTAKSAAFWNGSLKLPALRYADSLRRLKNLVHQGVLR